MNLFLFIGVLFQWDLGYGSSLDSMNRNRKMIDSYGSDLLDVRWLNLMVLILSVTGNSLFSPMGRGNCVFLYCSGYKVRSWVMYVCHPKV